MPIDSKGRTVTTINEARSRAVAAVNSQITVINQISRELKELRDKPDPDPALIASLETRQDAAQRDLPDLERKLRIFDDEIEDEARLTRAAAETHQHAERIPPGITQDRSRTYTERNSGQFLNDLWALNFGGIRREAQERLEKHENEARAAGQMTTRAGSTSGLGGVVPPQYLIDEFATVARAGRPTANTAKHLQIPAEGMSLVIPRGTAGTTTAVQSTQNSNVSNTDIGESDLTVPVITIAGQQDVSRQAIERATGVDQIIFSDLAMDYALKLNQQVLSGTGSSGQALGILNTTGVNQASAFTAAATVATFYSKVAGQLNAIQTTRFLAPDVIIMHPRRWSWLLAQLDSNNRPLVTPDQNGPQNSYAVSSVPVDTASGKSAGTMLGLPVITDASIPINVGTGPEDQVIIARDDDLLLWEDGDGHPTELRFEQTLANQLTIKLVAYGYVAFTAARYPTAVGLVGGNAGTAGYGLTTPVF